MSNKKNGEIDQINMSFTLTDDSESILQGSEQKNINIDYIDDQIFFDEDNSQNFVQQTNIQDQNQNDHLINNQDQKKHHHSSQITFGKGLPINVEIKPQNNQQTIQINNKQQNISQFKNYKQYIVSKDKIQDDKKNITKKNNYLNTNQDSNIQQISNNSQKNSNSVTITGNKLDKIYERNFQRNQNQQSSSGSNNNIINNNSQSNIRSSITHDETQSTNIMTCLMEKAQSETVEFLKNQLIIVQKENEILNFKLKEKDDIINEMKKNQNGIKEGLTIRDYEQTISKQAIELIQLRQTSQQLSKENKQLQQEIVKNKAEGFQKYEDLKQNNEQLLEVYEEKFQCQLKISSDNYLIQIQKLEQQHNQDLEVINKIQIEMQKSQNIIQTIQQENEKLKIEKEQCMEQYNKQLSVLKLFEGQQIQYLHNLYQPLLNSQDKQLNNITKEQSEQNNNNNNQNTNVLDSNSNNKNSNNTNLSDKLKIPDLQSKCQLDKQQQAMNNVNKIITQQTNDGNISFQNQSFNQSNLYSPRGKNDGQECNNALTDRKQYKKINNNNQTSIKVAKQLLSPQSNLSQLVQKQIINKTKTYESNSEDEEDNSMKNNNQKSQQNQFQLELGQVQMSKQQQQQLQYSYSTQITKRNHYLQQNISHRHYPSQSNQNLNISHHNKSVERHISPLSAREYQQPIQDSMNKSSSLQKQLNINDNCLSSQKNKQQIMQKKSSCKNINSSNSGIIDNNNIFQHETIKGFLQNQQSDRIQPQKQRDNNNKNTNKLIEAKKKKLISSQESRSFYDTINASGVNSNSLLILQNNKSNIIHNHNNNNDSNNINNSLKKLINKQSQSQLQNKNHQPLNQTISTNELVSHEIFQQVIDNQKNNIINQQQSPLMNLQNTNKSLSYKQLINPQQQNHSNNNNISKQNNNSQLSQFNGIPIPIPGLGKLCQAEQETFSPRIHSSRSTNNNTNKIKNNQSTNIISQTKLLSDKHCLSTQSDLISESPEILRQDRSTSGSNYKPQFSDRDDSSQIKQQKNQKSPFNSLKGQNHKDLQVQNKQNSSQNIANAYQKIKNQILQQQTDI